MLEPVGLDNDQPSGVVSAPDRGEGVLQGGQRGDISPAAMSIRPHLRPDPYLTLILTASAGSARDNADVAPPSRSACQYMP